MPPIQADNPVPGCQWTLFMVEIWFPASSPAKNCVDIVCINLLFESSIVTLAALRIVTGSIFNSASLVYGFYSIILIW